MLRREVCWALGSLAIGSMARGSTQSGHVTVTALRQPELSGAVPATQRRSPSMDACLTERFIVIDRSGDNRGR
jgi:hypothetical protein